MRKNSFIAAFCIALSLTAILTGCDKINEWRDSVSRNSNRRGDQAVTELQQVTLQNTAGLNPSLSNDIAARSILFVPDPALDASGVLKATFDNTFALSADVAVVISVDGLVAARGATRVPPQSRWTYSAPYTFTTPGEHALRMGVYLKGGMPMPEADVANNEVSGISSVTQDVIGQPAAADVSKKQPPATGDPAQGMDLNDIEARSIGFMPDGSARYTSQAVMGQPGVIRTTFSNGFNVDTNLRVNISDDESVLSDVVLSVPRRSQGAYFLKYIFDKPGMHKMRLNVYQAEIAYQERVSINNEMTTVINVIPPSGNVTVNRNDAPKDIVARAISFQPEGISGVVNTVETGALGRIKLDYTSTFTANSDLVISWFIDGNVIAETPVKNVPPGDHYYLIGYTFDTIGKHAIRAEIKWAGDGKAEEADMQNNKAEALVEVVPVPEPSREAPAPSRADAAVSAPSQQPDAGFSLVEPLGQQAEMPSGDVGAAEPVFQEGAVSTASESATYDLVSDSIVFVAVPGNEPVTSASVGQEGSIAYVVRNRGGAAQGVEVKIRLELEGKSKFSVAKKIDIPDTGVFKGVTGNLVLSQLGRYTLYLSADSPNNSDVSRSGLYFELKRALDVLPQISDGTNL